MLQQLLRQDAFITISKPLIKAIGTIPAIVYQELLSKYFYFKGQGKLKNGWFYCTIEDLENETGLKRRDQNTALTTLEKLCLLKKQIKKLSGDDAPRRYILINEDENVLYNILQSSQHNDKKREIDTSETVDNTGFVQNAKSNWTKIQNEMDKTPNLHKYNNKTIIINNNTVVVSDNIKLLKEKIESRIKAKFDIKRLKKLVETKGVNIIEKYLQNWDRFNKKNVRDIAAFFYEAVMNKYLPPKENKDTNNMRNFVEREYEENDSNLYLNILRYDSIT